MISSMSTMTFLIIIPSKPSQPAIGKKPNSKPVSNIPIATPIRDKGRIHKMITGSRKFPNKATRITISNKKASGKNLTIACIASPWSLNCESQKKE